MKYKNEVFSMRRSRTAAAVCAIVAAGLLLAGCSTSSGTPAAVTPSVTPQVTPAAPTLEAEPTPTPTPTPTPEPLASALSETPVCGLVPAQSTPAGDDFFADAAFLGNSLVDGLHAYGNLPGDFFASTSMTVLGAGSLVDQMPAGKYGKVYILLGINEIGFDAAYFCQQYALLLDRIQASQPTADIYIMSLTPVTAAKSAGGTFTMERISTYNQALLQLAESRGIWYIDLVTPMVDGTGFLPDAASTDGVHFTVDEYAVWANTLRSCYIPNTAVN